MANQFSFAILPTPVVASAGSNVSLQTILTQEFGANFGGYTDFWIAYSGADTLQANDFSYWDPSHPSVSSWIVNGQDIGSNNQIHISLSMVGNVSLHVGNDISPLLSIVIPISTDVVPWDMNWSYRLNVVDPSVMSPTAGSGAPNPSDIVASAYRFSAFYGTPSNTNDCWNIASDIAAAAGASLPTLSGSFNPAENIDGGFWRVVYRGSDPHSNVPLHSLLQSGDIIRMEWLNGTPDFPGHSTTVLSVNPNGSITVYDNSDFETGHSTIGIHTWNLDNAVVPTSVTIYRLSPDHLYLINGSDLGEVLNGSPYNNEIHTGAGTDVVNAGIGNDFVYLDGAGAKSVDGQDGVDTVVLSGARSTYNVSENATSLQVSGGGIAATLTNVEQIKFADGSFIYPTTGYHSIAGTLPHSTVLFDGNINQFQVTSNLDGSVSVVDSISNRDGANHITNVEFLHFSDKTIFVENADNANIARLYSAALGRAPDVGGESGWEDIYTNNISATAKAGGVYLALAQTHIAGASISIAQGFTLSTEFQQHYGTLDDAGFVSLLYQNVLSRAPSAAERDAWVANIHGGESREMVLVGFAESTENIAKTSADWLIQI